jgi:hypothetical protein
MLGILLLAAGVVYIAVKLSSIAPAAEDAASLRARANQAGDAMGRAFEDSHAAYARRDGKQAKLLSEEGKKWKAEMEELNWRASEMVFAGAHHSAHGQRTLLMASTSGNNKVTVLCDYARAFLMFSRIADLARSTFMGST